MVKRDDWNAVVNLVGERVDRVVDNHHVFHSAIGNDAQILHVVPLGCLDAMLPV